MIKKTIMKEIEIPNDVTVKVDKFDVTVKGSSGEVKKRLANKKVIITLLDNKVNITATTVSKNEKKIVHTFAAHIRNMIQGSLEPFVYKLKVCSGHFPMNVTLKGDSFSVKNLFGEKVPRVIKIIEGAKVKVDGDIITVECSDREIAGQVAADIEQLTRRVGFDRRIFQDGIYITHKAGKELK